MSDQSATPDTRDLSKLAEAVAVRTENDVLLVGWGVRQDTVVVQAGGLQGPLTVTIGDQEIQATEIFEANQDIDSWQPLTALELPEGSLNLAGDLYPPHMLPEIPSPDDPQTMGARVAFWCLVFPRMRGCF